jgi:hypothetical protein
MSDESPTEHFEHAEHAHHAHHAAESGDKLPSTVAMTIAVLAVIAATVGSLETLESGNAISAKNEAVLAQNKATDQWNFFQAKSIKKNMYAIAAANGGPNAGDFAKQAKKNDDESADIQKEAKALEDDAQKSLAAADMHEGRHHLLTVAVTLLHVSIAVATISIIIGGKKWPWHASMILGAVGSLVAGFAYLQ